MDQITHDVRSSQWLEIITQCQNRPEGTTAKQWMDDNGISEKSYYYKDSDNYVGLKYRGVVSNPNDVLSPEKYDFVKCRSSSFVRTDLSWTEYSYLTEVFKLPEIAEAKEDTIYYLDTYKYYICPLFLLVFF